MDGVVDATIDTVMAAVAFGIGIQKKLMSMLIMWVGAVTEDGILSGKVDNENQVRAFGDDNFVRRIDVQKIGGRCLEEVVFFCQSHEIPVPFGKPSVFQFRII